MRERERERERERVLKRRKTYNMKERKGKI